MRAAAVAAMVAVLGFAGARTADAASLSWLLTANTAGGGSVSGSFDYNATTGLYSNVAVTNTGGVAIPASLFDNVSLTAGFFPSPTRLSIATEPDSALLGGYKMVIDWDAALDDLGGTRSAVAGVIFECFDTICSGPDASQTPGVDWAGFTFASVEAAPVPLPAGAPLLLAGLAGLGLIARRRSRA